MLIARVRSLALATPAVVCNVQLDQFLEYIFRDRTMSTVLRGFGHSTALNAVYNTRRTNIRTRIATCRQRQMGISKATTTKFFGVTSLVTRSEIYFFIQMSCSYLLVTDTKNLLPDFLSRRTKIIRVKKIFSW